jgi:hypothetical protein
MGESEHAQVYPNAHSNMARKQEDARVGLAVEALAAKKPLFPNVCRKRHVEALFGKNPYDISERLNPF